MADWASLSGFDATTIAALWSIAGVLVATLVMFAYTVGLRAATLIGARQRERAIRNWRNVFAQAIVDADAAAHQPLPGIPRSERVYVLEEWNRTCSSVAGHASENLIEIGVRAGIGAIAARLLGRRRLQSKVLAVYTLGHLRDHRYRETIRRLVDHDNSALSITAAVALTDIDPDYAVQQLIPMIESRRDWPRTRVSHFLRMAGSERVSEPLYRAIRSARDADKVYLLQFARLIEATVLDALVSDQIRETRDPGVLNAALKLVSGFAGVPRIEALVRHETSYVRIQAATVLGRVGQPEHVPLLESMLSDPEWWVRYRAAQAIAALPFLGPNGLRAIRERQTDPYAADILQQSFAEVGLA